MYCTGLKAAVFLVSVEACMHIYVLNVYLCFYVYSVNNSTYGLAVLYIECVTWVFSEPF